MPQSFFSFSYCIYKWRAAAISNRHCCPCTKRVQVSVQHPYLWPIYSIEINSPVLCSQTAIGSLHHKQLTQARDTQTRLMEKQHLAPKLTIKLTHLHLIASVHGLACLQTQSGATNHTGLWCKIQENTEIFRPVETTSERQCQERNGALETLWTCLWSMANLAAIAVPMGIDGKQGKRRVAWTVRKRPVTRCWEPEEPVRVFSCLEKREASLPKWDQQQLVFHQQFQWAMSQNLLELQNTTASLRYSSFYILFLARLSPIPTCFETE